MSGAASGFLEVSKRFLDLLGPDGVGSEWEQRDFAIAGSEPRWVLMPSSVEECAGALRVCAGHGLAVVPAGFGRRLQQGYPPERLDVVLSLGRLDRIVDHAAADMTLVVEAGAALAAVDERLAAAGQFLPFDPPFPGATSIGGLIAANASGPLRQAFGTVRESLIGIRAVLADGTVVKSGGRVVKNVAGYDLHRLFVGSFGTLGVVVEASFKCQPRPARTETLVFRGAPSALLVLAGRIAGSPIGPRFLELLVDGESPASLAVGVAGDEAVLRWASARATEIAAGVDGVAAAEERADVGAVLEAIARPATDDPQLVIRAGMSPRALSRWLEGALDAASAHGGARGHAHAGVGVARLRIEPIAAEAARPLVDRLRAAALAERGYLVVESAPAGWKLDPWGPAAAHSLTGGLKRAFDPAGLLSPGRFVGAGLSLAGRA